MKRLIAGLCVLLMSMGGGVALAESASATPGHGGGKGDHKITFCHSGNGKHYKLITASKASFHRQGHVDHEDDIYPAGSWREFSWPAQGDQSLLETGCVKAAPGEPGGETPDKPDALTQTRDKVAVQCEVGSVVTRHQERTRDWVWDAESGEWVKAAWTGWVTMSKDARDATLAECPVADQTETRSRDTGADCASGKVTFVEESRTRSAVEWADGKPVFGDWSDWTQTRVGTREATEAELKDCPVTEEPPTDEPPTAKPPVKHEVPAQPVQEAAPAKPPMTPVAVNALPRTGIEAGPLAGIAAGLVLLGAGALVVARRKRG